MACFLVKPMFFVSVAVVAFGGAACTGSIADSEVPGSAEGGGSNGSSAGGSGPIANSCAKPDVGPAPLRRLTRAQYDNTVATLLGDTTRQAKSFVPDETLLGFAAGLSVSGLLVDQYGDSAASLAAAAVTNLPKLMGCDPKTTGEDACAATFIESFGKRAWRRPLTTEERTDLIALYNLNKPASGFSKSIELVVQALLQSPDFLYRVELGSPSDRPGIVKLNAWELASRLSYFLWNAMPDDVLFAAAMTGKLDTPSGIAAEVSRMTGDTRLRVAVDDFHAQWLDLDKLSAIGKDSKLYPQFDDKLRGAMRDETLRFVESVVLDGDGKLSTLLQAPWSMLTEPVAAIYGMTGVTGTTSVRKELPVGQRFGLLTHPSVMSVYAKTNQSSPVHRGIFVREHLLCQTPPPPPAGLMVQAPDPDPKLSTRQRFAEHSSNASCAACHSLLDPLGFGFEHYDAIGRWRDNDGAVAVDATGKVNDTDVDGAFNGVGELSAKLAKSQDVADCVVGKWFVYALGRSASNDRDSCSVKKLGNDFKTSGGNVRQLLANITTTDAFRFSRVDFSQGGK